MTGDKKIPYAPLTQEDAPPSYSTVASTSLTPFNQQPTAINQMSIGGARNAKGLQVGLDGKRDWNHDLTACCERPGLTTAACFCPCIVYSQNHHRLVSLTATGQPTESTQPVSLWCGLYFLAPQFAGVGQAFLQCFARNQTRSRYAIRGNEVQDLLVGAFCQPCSLVQESREIEEEEEAIRNLGGAAPEAIYRDEEEGEVVAVVA